MLQGVELADRPAHCCAPSSSSRSGRMPPQRRLAARRRQARPNVQSALQHVPPCVPVRPRTASAPTTLSKVSRAELWLFGRPSASALRGVLRAFRSRAGESAAEPPGVPVVRAATIRPRGHPLQRCWRLCERAPSARVAAQRGLSRAFIYCQDGDQISRLACRGTVLALWRFAPRRLRCAIAVAARIAVDRKGEGADARPNSSITTPAPVMSKPGW